LFCARTHPISIIINLILITIIITLILRVIFKNRWIRIIFILIILGGILILFIYMARLASNEPFLYKNIIMIVFPFILLPLMPFSTFINPLEIKNMSLIFNSFSAINTFIRIFYLLITLLVTIEIISNFKTPLRSNI